MEDKKCEDCGIFNMCKFAESGSWCAGWRAAVSHKLAAVTSPSEAPGSARKR